MSTRRLRAGAAALLLANLAASGRAQVLGGLPTAQVLLQTQFHTPLTYEAALQQLDTYYQEQVNRKLAVAFPEVAPKQHYDVWHDMWVSFDTSGEKMTVTMKRPADSITSRLVKNWMLTFAGRLNADIPLQYKELPAPNTAKPTSTPRRGTS